MSVYLNILSAICQLLIDVVVDAWPASWQVTAGTGGERAAAFAAVSCAALVLPF
jgi:hypothetical protein